MALTLRLQKGTALTNKELDDNFIYLEGLLSDIQGDITDINAALAALQVGFNSNLTGKQAFHPRLQAISQTTGTGFLVVSGTTVFPRSVVPGANVVITNQDGVAANTIIDVGPNVVITNTAQTLSNKTISGNNNNISSISLDSNQGRTQQVIGILPIANGGTNASTEEQARLNLDVLRRPVGIGVVVKTGTNTSVTRFLQVTGNGISITNASGELDNPTIALNSSSGNNANSIVIRNNEGVFSTTRVIGDLEGTATLALEVVNGVYTTGRYENPDWLVSINGSKVVNQSITNNKLANSTITINGKTVALGGSTTISAGDISGTPLNQPNTLVQRDQNGNFAAGTITASFFDGTAALVRNGVYSNTVYQNPSWIGSLAGPKVTQIPNSSLVNSSITINGQSVALGGQVRVPENAGFTAFHRWVNVSGQRKPWFANRVVHPGGPYKYETKTVNGKAYYDAVYVGEPTSILPNGTGETYTNNTAYIIHVKATYLNDEWVSAYGMAYAFVDGQLVALSGGPLFNDAIRTVTTIEFMVPPGSTYKVYFQDEPNEAFQQPGHWNWHWVEFRFDDSVIPPGTRVPEGLTGSLRSVAGYTGSQGLSVVGYTGSSGYTGSRGNLGYTGSAGPQGPQGIPGTGGGLGVAPQKWRNFSNNPGPLLNNINYSDAFNTKVTNYLPPKESTTKYIAFARWGSTPVRPGQQSWTYQNTSGRPIQIMAECSVTVGSINVAQNTYVRYLQPIRPYLYLDGFYIPLPYTNENTSPFESQKNRPTWSVVIPTGSIYSLCIPWFLDQMGSVTADLDNIWFELS